MAFGRSAESQWIALIRFISAIRGNFFLVVG